MDYEIAFDETEQSYRVITGYEFSAIADWVSEYLTEREEIQKILQLIHLTTADTEKEVIQHGVYCVEISAEGVTVSRQVDMSDASEEISAMFDGQSSFFQASEEGIKGECGLDDLTTLLENWYKVLY